MLVPAFIAAPLRRRPQAYLAALALALAALTAGSGAGLVRALEPALMRGAAALLALGLALVVASAAGAAGPVVSYTVTAGTTGDNGWYRSAVTAQLSVQGAIDSDCPLVKTFRTSSDAVDCTATDGSSTVQFHLQFKIDTDAPAVTTAAPDRAPDAGGWYSHPVTVTFSGNDTTSGIAGCTTATYSGPDSGSASVGGTCRDNAGNVSSTASFGLRYDTTAPTVTAKLSRPPDANGWYSHAVNVSFSGTDSGSGVSSCTAPVSYAGPDSAKATITGGCVDAAGNRASASASLQYDSTAPKLANVAVSVVSRERHADAGVRPRTPPSCRSRARPGRGKKRTAGRLPRPRIELPRHAAPAGVSPIGTSSRRPTRRGTRTTSPSRRSCRRSTCPRRGPGSRPVTCSRGRR